MVIFLSIFLLLMGAYGFLIGYYHKAWNGIPEFIPGSTPQVRISVIIAARNEEGNIAAILNSLRAQDYSREFYEVIVVNDHSQDGTLQTVQEFAAEDMRLTALSLPPGRSSKKEAIATGVNHATGELIVTTDADCIVPPAWLSTVASFYRSTGARFIVGPVRMTCAGSLPGIFQCLDFLTLQGITGASVHKRFHTMCSGANIAYTKQAFLDVGGFEGIDNIPSGDDMLLMHKIYVKHPKDVFYLKSIRAIVETPALHGVSAFLHQRVRWASKAVHYKDRRIFFALLLVLLVNAGFLALAVAAFWELNWLFFLLLFLLAKTLIEYPFVNAVALFFSSRKYMVYLPLFQPLHIIYTVVAGVWGRFGSYTWKSRKVGSV